VKNPPERSPSFFAAYPHEKVKNPYIQGCPPERPVTIKEVVEVFGVAYGTARSDMLRLAAAGYLEKRTMGKEFTFMYRGKSE